MARPRNPNRELAQTIWEQSGRVMPLTQIASEIGESESSIRKWKCQDKWEQSNGNVTKQKPKHKHRISNVTIGVTNNVLKSADNAVAKSVQRNNKLNNQQKLFCIYYSKTFNAGQSAIKAGYSNVDCYRYGYELLNKPHVKAEIEHLIQLRREAILASEQDVLDLHTRIAFADLTDYVGLTDVKDMDGQLIQEVTQKNGELTVKLIDKQKSLAFLERYYEMNPTINKKLCIEQKKLELLEKHQQSLEGDIDIQPNLEATLSTEELKALAKNNPI